MRSTLFVPLFAAAAVAAFAPACSVDAANGLSNLRVGDGAGAPPAFGVDTADDGGVTPQAPAPLTGSKLCGYPREENRATPPCNPDSPTSGAAKDCAASVGGQDRPACRVGPAKDLSCYEATAGGVDGVVCTKGEDCADGFDCVDGADGPTCRRYCCTGKCGAHLSQNGGKTFCDIKKLVASADQNIPVCMPIKACELLTAGECAADETCAVVTENGETGCVAVGGAGVDASCEEDHCQVGLTCIGQAGNRKCYQLCKMGVANACGPNEECKTSALFDEGLFGLCKKL